MHVCIHVYIMYVCSYVHACWNNWRKLSPDFSPTAQVETTFVHVYIVLDTTIVKVPYDTASLHGISSD